MILDGDGNGFRWLEIVPAITAEIQAFGRRPSLVETDAAKKKMVTSHKIASKKHEMVPTESLSLQ